MSFDPRVQLWGALQALRQELQPLQEARDEWLEQYLGDAKRLARSSAKEAWEAKKKNGKARKRDMSPIKTLEVLKSPMKQSRSPTKVKSKPLLFSPGPMTFFNTKSANSNANDKENQLSPSRGKDIFSFAPVPHQPPSGAGNAASDFSFSYYFSANGSPAKSQIHAPSSPVKAQSKERELSAIREESVTPRQLSPPPKFILDASLKRPAFKPSSPSPRPKSPPPAQQNEREDNKKRPLSSPTKSPARQRVKRDVNASGNEKKKKDEEELERIRSLVMLIQEDNSSPVKTGMGGLESVEEEPSREESVKDVLPEAIHREEVRMPTLPRASASLAPVRSNSKKDLVASSPAKDSSAASSLSKKNQAPLLTSNPLSLSKKDPIFSPAPAPASASDLAPAKLQKEAMLIDFSVMTDKLADDDIPLASTEIPDDELSVFDSPLKFTTYVPSKDEVEEEEEEFDVPLNDQPSRLRNGNTGSLNASTSGSNPPTTNFTATTDVTLFSNPSTGTLSHTSASQRTPASKATPSANTNTTTTTPFSRTGIGMGGSPKSAFLKKMKGKKSGLSLGGVSGVGGSSRWSEVRGKKSLVAPAPQEETKKEAQKVEMVEQTMTDATTTGEPESELQTEGRTEPLRPTASKEWERDEDEAESQEQPAWESQAVSQEPVPEELAGGPASALASEVLIPQIENEKNEEQLQVESNNSNASEVHADPPLTVEPQPQPSPIVPSSQQSIPISNSQPIPTQSTVYYDASSQPPSQAQPVRELKRKSSVSDLRAGLGLGVGAKALKGEGGKRESVKYAGLLDTILALKGNARPSQLPSSNSSQASQILHLVKKPKDAEKPAIRGVEMIENEAVEEKKVETEIKSETVGQQFFEEKQVNLEDDISQAEAMEEDLDAEGDVDLDMAIEAKEIVKSPRLVEKEVTEVMEMHTNVAVNVPPPMARPAPPGRSSSVKDLVKAFEAEKRDVIFSNPFGSRPGSPIIPSFDRFGSTPSNSRPASPSRAFTEKLLSTTTPPGSPPIKVNRTVSIEEVLGVVTEEPSREERGDDVEGDSGDQIAVGQMEGTGEFVDAEEPLRMDDTPEFLDVEEPLNIDRANTKALVALRHQQSLADSYSLCANNKSPSLTRW
ncbi:hypothetical protein BT69DRAFT_515247 [Atractiella rhizophila]|nr:hypothetical protein BT69DRAFT_515247 [Atractiella rhizophila]